MKGRGATCSSRGVACSQAPTAAASPAEMLSNTVGGWPLLIMRVANSQNTADASVYASAEVGGCGKRQNTKSWGEEFREGGVGPVKAAVMRKASRSELRGLSCCSKNEADIKMTITLLHLRVPRGLETRESYES